MPIFNKSSSAIRSSPQVGLFSAVSPISLRTSTGTRGRPADRYFHETAAIATDEVFGGRQLAELVRGRSGLNGNPPPKSVITSLAGFESPVSVITSLAAFAGARRPHPPAGRTAIPSSFRYVPTGSR